MKFDNPIQKDIISADKEIALEFIRDRIEQYLEYGEEETKISDLMKLYIKRYGR